MEYSREQLKQDTQNIIKEIFALQDEKGKDYASQEDSLENYRDLEYPYAVLRLCEKAKRLKNLVKGKSTQNIETHKVIAELKDILNISILAVILAEPPKSNNPIESLTYKPEGKEK